MIAVIDVETTGLDATHDRLVGVAVVSSEGAVLYDTRVNPERLIPPDASAIHHLTDADVRDAPLRSAVAVQLEAITRTHNRPTWAAHNAPFEQAFLPELTAAPWICTMRVARHLWPEAPAFGLQVLRYYLKLPVGAGRPHSALDDARVTAALLEREIRTVTEWGFAAPVDRLLSLSRTPALLATVGFGKHRGQRWSAVPRDYLEWASGETWDDPDVKATIEAALNGRFAGEP